MLEVMASATATSASPSNSRMLFAVLALDGAQPDGIFKILVLSSVAALSGTCTFRVCENFHSGVSFDGGVFID